MAERRKTGVDACPIDEEPVTMDKCQPCIFFRGAASYPSTKGWTVTCNWPRNGSDIYQAPIPDAFLKAFGGEE